MSAVFSSKCTTKRLTVWLCLVLLWNLQRVPSPLPGLRLCGPWKWKGEWGEDGMGREKWRSEKRK